MILIDTSVWIEFFRQNTAFADHVKYLLQSKSVVTIEPVFSELLYGVRNKQEEEMVRSFWQLLPKIAFGAQSMIAAASFANARNYHLLGIGVIDALLIQATEEGDHLLWTLNSQINQHIRRPLIYHPD